MFTRTKRTTKRVFNYAKDDVLNVKEAQGHYQDAKSLVEEHALGWRKKKDKRTETFQAAMDRKGLTLEDIASSYKHYSVHFYIFSFFTSLALFLGLWAVYQGNPMGGLAGLGGVFICAGQLFSASFRCFQIRHHEMLPVSAWWQSKSEWLPGEYIPPRSASRSIVRK